MMLFRCLFKKARGLKCEWGIILLAGLIGLELKNHASTFIYVLCAARGTVLWRSPFSTIVYDIYH